MIYYSRPTITKKDIISVLNCLLEDELGKNDLISQFEKSFAQFLKVKHCLVVNHLSSAFYILFRSLELQQDDEVILSTFCHPSTLFALEHLKIKPILLDVAEESLSPTEEQIKKALTKKTKAIIISHPLGYPTILDKSKITENLSKKEAMQIKWVEECSYALGSKIKENFVGTDSHYGVFSFDSDNIITTLKGAAIVSNEMHSIKKMKQIANYNSSLSDDTEGQLEGQLDFTITNLQAALGSSELSFAVKFLKRREEISDFYKENIRKSKNKFLAPIEKSKSNHYTLPIFFNHVSLAKELLKKYKIEVVLPLEKTIFGIIQKRENILKQNFSLSIENFPNSKDLFIRLLAVPLYPSLKKKELELIGNLLRSIG